MVTKRDSSLEWSGSSIVIDKGSLKTVEASSNVTPCFSLFDRSLAGSHSKRSAMTPRYYGKDCTASSGQTSYSTAGRKGLARDGRFHCFDGAPVPLNCHCDGSPYST